MKPFNLKLAAISLHNTGNDFILYKKQNLFQTTLSLNDENINSRSFQLS